MRRYQSEIVVIPINSKSAFRGLGAVHLGGWVGDMGKFPGRGLNLHYSHHGTGSLTP